MSVILKNNAKCDAVNTFTAGDSSIDLGAGNGALFPVLVDGCGEYFYITVVDQNDEDILEILKVTITNGDIFAVDRGMEGTTPRICAVGDKIEMRITQEILSEISNTNDKRQYLDEIFLCYKDNGLPVDASDIMHRNHKNAPKLVKFSKWNNYWGSRVKVLIEDVHGHTKYDDISLLTENDFFDWMTDHHTELSHAGQADQTLIVRPYETIDQSIPVITRMYGLNRFYSSLRGKNNYRKSVGTAINSSNMEDKCADIFNSIHGSSFTAGTIDTGAIWLSCAKTNTYSSPKFFRENDYIVDFANSGTTLRKVRNPADTAWIANTTDKYENRDRHTIRYATLDTHSNMNIYEVSSGSRNYVDSDMLNGASVLMCVGMEDTNGNHNKAVAVKPMGMDCIVVDYPDFSKYDFEMVYFNYNKQNFVDVKSFSSTGDFSYSDVDPNNTKMRINSAEWLRTGVEYSNSTSKYNQIKWDTVRFRLRDKATGKVGELSYAGIVTETRRQLAYRQMLVKSMI